MFQSVLTVDSEDAANGSMALDSDNHTDEDTSSDNATDDDEEREYYTAFIDGVRSLRYHIVVPPDGPSAPWSQAQQDNSGNANDNLSTTPFHLIPVGGRTKKQQEWTQHQTRTPLNQAAWIPTRGEKENLNLPGARG